MKSEPIEITSLRNDRKPCHFWVDNEIVDCYQPIIGADAVWVYCRIARYANGPWIVSPRLRGTSDTRVGMREMAEWCGKSTDTVWRSLEILKFVGLIHSVCDLKSKGRYALADAKDLVLSEGGLYDRQLGAFCLPAERTAELKEQVRELRLKLARKKSVQARAPAGEQVASATVAQSDSLKAGLFSAPDGKCDRSVALDVQNCRSGATDPRVITEELKKASKSPPTPQRGSGATNAPSAVALKPEAKPLAARLLDLLGLAATRYDLDIVGQVIALEARAAHSDPEEACKFLLGAAQEAIRRRETVNAFWFKDRKFAGNDVAPLKPKTAYQLNAEEQCEERRRRIAERGMVQ
jgi:hypothetical protein